VPPGIRPLSLAALAAGSLLLAAPALAAPGWTAAAAYPLPPGADPQLARVGYQFGGQATVAFVATAAGSPARETLDAGVVAPGRGYAQQLQLAPGAGAAVTDVSLAVALDGAAVLAWETGTGAPPYTFLASYRAAGAGSWSAPVTVATDAFQVTGIAPRVVSAISPGGAAAVAVEHLDATLTPGGYRLDVLTFAPSGATGGPVQLGPAGASVENVAVGYDTAGDLTAAFDAGQPGGGTYSLGEQQLPAGGSWSAEQQLTASAPAQDAGPPRLALAPDGSAVVAFTLAQAGGAPELDASTRAGSGGGWSAPATLVSSAAATPLAAGLSASDTAYVMYALAGAGACAGAVRAPSGSAWSAPACVPGAGAAPAAGSLAFVGQDAYLVWSAPSPGTAGATVQGTRWPAAASAPGPATSLDDSASGLELDALTPDGDGSVAAFWSSPAALRVSAFDAGGPVLLAAGVPAVLTAEQVSTLSVTFADLWSPVASVVWSFGDGSPPSEAPYETGAQVAHAYAAPGAYTLTATATDGDGNTTAATFHVTVTPPLPALRRLRQAASVWREPGPPGPAGRSGLPRGTRFSMRLSETAVVTLRFARRATGRRVATACLPSAPAYADDPPCSFARAAGAVTFDGHRGVNRLRFDGRLPAGHRLPPGRYTVTVSATAPGGSSALHTLRFTIARR
jgi:PKD domain